MEQPVANQPAQPSDAVSSSSANAGALLLHHSPLASETPVRAPLSFHSSTASMRHTSGGRMLFRHLLLPRTSSLRRLAPFHRNSVSRSSSQHTGLTQKHKATVPDSTLVWK
jgi:hypothetical protein